MGSRETADAHLERWVQRSGHLLLALALLVLFAAAIVAIGDAVLAPTPTPTHPGFVDTVLGSRAVVAAIRLAIIFAGVFVVVSVVALIARGQWLTKVGPVQVSDGDSGSRRLGGSLGKADETIDSLRQATEEVNDLLDRMKHDSKGVK